MITLKEWMETVDYRITEGSEYTWTCFGNNAYSLDSWNGEQNGHTFHIIFDTRTQEVYQVDAHDYKNRRSYRMINPEYLDAYNESVKHHSIKDVAYDDVKFIDLEVDEDWLEKARCIFLGGDYDTRVQVPIDFSDEELLTHMKAAHNMDITFNQYVVQALTEAINNYRMLEESK
jgi:hypothetical protein